MLLVLTFMGFCSLTASGQEVVKEKTYKIQLPSGWTRTNRVPQGYDVGFQKETAEGNYATFYLHVEVMPVETGELLFDTSYMKHQWDTKIENKYIDVRSVTGTVPNVSGRILFNSNYELTDQAQKVQHRYTQFLSGRTAFIAQCSASPTQWESVLPDFNAMLASILPGGSAPDIQTKSDKSTKSKPNISTDEKVADLSSSGASAKEKLPAPPSTSTVEPPQHLTFAPKLPKLEPVELPPAPIIYKLPPPPTVYTLAPSPVYTVTPSPALTASTPPLPDSSNTEKQSIDQKNQTLPPTGIFKEYVFTVMGATRAPFEIVTSEDKHNYFVKLVDWTSGDMVLTLFIRSGQTIDIDVPLGSYKMKYATGTAWYGETLLFGSETLYFEADKKFDFEVTGNQVSGYSVELYLQLNGNLATKSISAKQF